MYQQIMLVGHLGSSPEMRYTPNGAAVTSFRMATSRSWNDSSGQRHEKVNWWRVSVWGKQAETVQQYLDKGSKVLVVGEVEEARAYTDKMGNPAASLEVKASTVRFLSNKGDATDSVTVEGAESIPF